LIREPTVGTQSIQLGFLTLFASNKRSSLFIRNKRVDFLAGSPDGQHPRQPQLHLRPDLALRRVEPKTDQHVDRFLPPAAQKLDPGRQPAAVQHGQKVQEAQPGVNVIKLFPFIADDKAY